jgi:hypothetical protein
MMNESSSSALIISAQLLAHLYVFASLQEAEALGDTITIFALHVIYRSTNEVPEP